MEKIKFTEVPEKIPSGYDCIDNLMQGGIEPGIITEFYGFINYIICNIIYS